MNPPATSHVEPSEHSTPQVDQFLDMVEHNIDKAPGSGSPAIKPNKALDDGGKPATDTPHNPKL